MFGLARTSVVYCHTDAGCKVAVTKLQTANGIADAKNGTIYVANNAGGLYVLERQNDDSLVLSEYIKTGKLPNSLGLPFHDVTKKIVSWTILPSTQMAPSGLRVSKSVLETLFI